jgi:putative transcriptional regulator
MGVNEQYLTGNLIIAMPAMPDTRFSETVIYLCAHSEEGAMGLVINRLVDSIDFKDLLEQLDVGDGLAEADLPVHFGGPVETGRGFVLHSLDYTCEGTMEVDSDIALSASVEVLQEIAEGRGPTRRLLALGYAGWGAGQLEQEIQDNGWLHVDADDDLIFGADNDGKWTAALAKIGIDPAQLASNFGRA